MDIRLRWLLLGALPISLFGCDEWLATKRDDSPTVRLATAQSPERSGRPESGGTVTYNPPPRVERPAPPSVMGTPSANVLRPPPPPNLAPTLNAPARPSPAGMPEKAAMNPSTPPPGVLNPTAPRPFPAAPRFPAAPQPGASDQPRLVGGSEAQPVAPGQRMPPGPRPMLPHMPSMRIARPPPQQ